MMIVVTGATGFLGRRVVHSMLNSFPDAEFRCLVRPGTDIAGLKDACGEQFNRLQLTTGTLLSAADCNTLVKEADLLVHLASGTSGAPAEYFLNSSVATRNLLTALSVLKQKTKFLHCSSFSVYGYANLPAGAVVAEDTAIECLPEKRDVYAQSKIHQEKLVVDICKDAGISYSIIRPGVIYGPGGSAISPRVGMKLFGRFIHLGRATLIPLTYVDNCAEAFSVVAEKSTFAGDVYNVVDDDLVSSRQFLRLYRANVEKLKSIPVPYFALKLISFACERYHAYSGGQLPDIFTTYKTKSMWKGFRYTNEKLKSLGWTPTVITTEGLRRHFTWLSGLRDE